MGNEEAEYRKKLRKGLLIIQEAAHSKNREERIIAGHLQRVFQNTTEISKTERRLGIKPGDSESATFLRHRADLLRIIANSNRVPLRQTTNLFLGNLWKLVVELKRASTTRIRDLRSMQKQRKRALKAEAARMAARQRKQRFLRK